VVGKSVGVEVGKVVGVSDGLAVGIVVGSAVGVAVGTTEGAAVGPMVGAVVGVAVGAKVITHARSVHAEHNGSRWNPDRHAHVHVLLAVGTSVQYVDTKLQSCEPILQGWNVGARVGRDDGACVGHGVRMVSTVCCRLRHLKVHEDGVRG
jgi:hypothetical protein